MLKRGSSLASVILLVVPLAVFAAAPVPHSAPAEKAPQKAAPKGIDPEAKKALKRMATYLSGLQNFTVDSETTDEVVLTSGSKVGFISNSKVSVRRPNGLRSEQTGPNAMLTASYDGTNLSLYCKATNTYGTVPAPANIDAMLAMARKKFEIDAPAADLLSADPYEVLTADATVGIDLGIESIDGVAVRHLGFQEAEIDWQIWIQEGEQPLPVRFVITTKTMPSQPQFTARPHPLGSSPRPSRLDLHLPAADRRQARRGTADELFTRDSLKLPGDCHALHTPASRPHRFCRAVHRHHPDGDGGGRSAPHPRQLRRRRPPHGSPRLLLSAQPLRKFQRMLGGCGPPWCCS